ncbi:flavoprotein [Penicillium angulare]|uniref:flavoprotein n=1 Tax=Penicillium angulare TaxID=116970 RepID=UPI00254158E1|nr:flavoprotein [Penicillium angulare]KAJ5288160.1 flavoprotein [Penicillium angulare]
MTHNSDPVQASYSQIAYIGTGLSAIALGATLKRWYDMDDVHFFERHRDCGETWHISSYPAEYKFCSRCGCDVPNALYIFSFALSSRWTKLMPSNKEIKSYHDNVVHQYGLRDKMTFSTEVQESVWREDASRWFMKLRNVITGEVTYHEAQILFAATEQLVEPKACDIPGAQSFNGSLFNSAKWDHSVNLEGKNVVVIGNVCTAAQIVPAIVERTKSLTQIVRSKHWVFPAPKSTYPRVLQWVFTYVPLAMRLHRFHIFLIAEKDFRLFPMTKSAARLREKHRQKVEKYMRETAPTKYHDTLIPDFDVGCKRRIFDGGYLKSLHNDKLNLTQKKITEILPDGINTTNGFYPADVIVLATGFLTNTFLPYTQIRGSEGTVTEHWDRYDGPGAYNCSAMSGFPNFFLSLGPNAATGHTSALMAAENSVNYALRVLRPVLNGEAASINLKQEAEDSYIYRVQETPRNRVWNAGCASWYLNEKKWNAMAYPWTQAHFWWRSLFPTWSDWTSKLIQKPGSRRVGLKFAMVWILAVGVAITTHSQSPLFWSTAWGRLLQVIGLSV